MSQDIALVSAVKDALEWLKKNPRYDYVDAAYMVAASPHRTTLGAVFGTSRWPELVEALRAATMDPQNLPYMS